MLSILGKLICKELGEQKYDMYFECYSRYVNSDDNGPKSRHNEMIFRDIYKQLGNKDIYTLQKMLERLLGAIELSVRISRQYMWVWMCTVITIILLIFIPVSLWWTVCGICIVITCFGYKSAVFLINRYCFIDANIVLLYKTALYHMILTYNVRKLSAIS